MPTKFYNNDNTRRRCDYCQSSSLNTFFVRDGDCTGRFDRDACFNDAREEMIKAGAIPNDDQAL